MKIAIDQDVADIIFKKTLVDLILMNVEIIRELLEANTLQQWEIEDLCKDRENLLALIVVYTYTNIDGDRWDNIIEELLT